MIKKYIFYCYKRCQITSFKKLYDISVRRQELYGCNKLHTQKFVLGSPIIDAPSHDPTSTQIIIFKGDHHYCHHHTSFFVSFPLVVDSRTTRPNH